MSTNGEDAPRLSEEHIKALIDSIADYAIITINPQAVITVWNTGAENIFGFTANEAIGQHVSIIYTPEDRASGYLLQEMQSTRDSGRSEDERYHIRKDGVRIYLSGVMSPLLNADKLLTGFVKVARDLTERKNLEHFLIDADRQKDEYIAMLGHELRNPLAPISNVIQILKMTHANDPSINPAVELMSRQVEHMTRLVNDLLDMSRISRRKINLRLERMDLVDAVKRAIEMMQPSLADLNRLLTVKLPDHAVFIYGDLTRIIQIITNLLSNAAKFTLPEGLVWLTVQDDENEATITVRDNGIGIALEQQDEIFKPFVQLDAAVDRSRGGLGLGLAMVRQLVNMHSGTVKVNSGQSEGGSEFIITFPLDHNVI